MDEVSCVVDVIITSDYSDMSGPYEEKCYYARLDIIDWVATVYLGKPCVLGGFSELVRSASPCPVKHPPGVDLHFKHVATLHPVDSEGSKDAGR